MNQSAAERFIHALYVTLQRRKPGESELKHWVHVLLNELSADEVFYRFIGSLEFKDKTRVKIAFPPGHYYSPIVDPEAALEYVHKARSQRPEEIAGISFDIAKMIQFWLEHRSVLTAAPFTAQKIPVNRYWYKNGFFGIGDSLTLWTMIHALRPSRVIEVGSGFSTACLLDAADHADLKDLRVTCIEPYPDRLKLLLRPDDFNRVDLVAKRVQDCSPELFKMLRSGDILFIDSTHVLKTGSDVHYELFNVLPVLASGVIIHFHDIHYPFEYIPAWVANENYSWNEAYGLRSFLMYNDHFRVLFFNSLFGRECSAVIAETAPAFLHNPGGSIWIEKLGNPADLLGRATPETNLMKGFELDTGLNSKQHTHLT